MSNLTLKALTIFAASVCFTTAAYSQAPLKINSFLDEGVTPLVASQDQLKKAVYGVMAADLEFAPSAIAETVSGIPSDRTRIDTILTASVAYLKEQAIQATALDTTITDENGEQLPPIASGPSVAYDCTKVLEIWSLAVAAAPDMDQFIIEVGMREAPECFQGALSEAITETGSITRQFNLMSIGLNGAPSESNTGSPDEPNGPGPVSPSN